MSDNSRRAYELLHSLNNWEPMNTPDWRAVTAALDEAEARGRALAEPQGAPRDEITISMNEYLELVRLASLGKECDSRGTTKRDMRGPLSIAQDEAEEALGPDPREYQGAPQRRCPDCGGHWEQNGAWLETHKPGCPRFPL